MTDNNGRKGVAATARVRTATVISVLMVLGTLGGLAAAAWFSGTSLTEQGRSGTTDVSYVGPVVITTSNAYVNCSVWQTSAAGIHFTADNLGPGDYCIIAGNVTNTGSLPVTLDQSTVTMTGSCASFYAIDTISNPTAYTIGPGMNGNTYSFPVASGGISIAPGATVTENWAIGLFSSAPQAGCSGQSFSATSTLIGTTAGGNGP